MPSRFVRLPLSPTTLAMIGLAYAAAILVSLTTRFDGGLAYMWLANGVLAAVLAKQAVRAWLSIALVAMPISALLTSVAGLGPVAAGPLAVLNFGEAAILALALRRWAPLDDGALRSISQVVALIGGGVVAAVVSGAPSAWVASAVSSTQFATNWLNWINGHSLGAIAVTPIAVMLVSGDLNQWWRDASHGERVEGGCHAALVTGVALATFSQAIMPASFLPILPVTLATFRMGRVGAAVAMLILATIAISFSMHGMGPVALMPPDPAARIHMVQFYLATIALTVLPAAADLRRRKDVVVRLAASEARYRLVTENASDIILTLDANGAIRFVSPSIEGMGDYRVAALIGTPASALVAGEHRPIAMRAHLEALRAPGQTQIVEVRTDPERATATRWIEMRVRAIEPDAGGAVEMICAIRDITKRKAVEAELVRAARTDPLTGLANRRVFSEAIDLVFERLSRGGAARACIAIFDIDHFKRVNDEFGHDAGDRVLERFAGVAARHTRANDLVARLGGEEFGLVLPGSDPHEARVVCERLRRDFAGVPTMLDDGRAIWTTVSAGVAVIAPGSDRGEAMREADAALYAAKRAGRDRLVLAA
ncbi:diguanylate cyclase [Sphingomonas sp.]|uniref:sensor domain-containing diguanylate cyclase n=1 Tax=Sphingomonas sp. TaxID=28214 RepID=UPI002C554AEE|nr:diguanylate cyclase [Sphingomonas sp.]HTG39407.1 diguanylate cyclase [Sphingomonas sp.]